MWQTIVNLKEEEEEEEEKEEHEHEQEHEQNKNKESVDCGYLWYWRLLRLSHKHEIRIFPKRQQLVVALPRIVWWNQTIVCCYWHKVCRETIAGRKYIGQTNTTITGIQCQTWTANEPHIPNDEYIDTDFPDGSRAAAENYCRNPDASWSRGVWCYTMDPDVRWDQCYVPECGKYDHADSISCCVMAIKSFPTWFNQIWLGLHVVKFKANNPFCSVNR